MPTGYTAPIEDDPAFTFEQYVWRCARAFGALGHMREDKMDAVADLAVRPDVAHDAARLKEAREELARLETMTGAEMHAAADKWNADSAHGHEARQARREELTARHEAMAARVREWRPPTPEHAKLQRFMMEQLATGWPDYLRKPEDLPRPLDAREWHRAACERAGQSVGYHTAQIARARALAEDHTAWLRALDMSVPRPNQ